MGAVPVVERVPPQSMEAEKATLGAMLLERDAIARVVDYLTPDDFYRDLHRQLYQVMLQLFQEGEPVDLVTLGERLRKRDLLEQVGGMPYLLHLQESAPSAAAVASYARTVREKAILRGLIHAAGEISGQAYEPGDQAIEEIVDRCEQQIFAVGERTITPGFTPLKPLLAEAYERIEEMAASHLPGTGLRTRFRELDGLTSGFQPSDLIILAARPSVGKTALALNIAAHVAAEQKKTVAVFSLEMAKEQLALRLLCSEAGVNQQSVREAFIEEGDLRRLALAADKLYNAPLHIDDSPILNVLEIRGKARRLRAELGALDLIIVDYLQLVSGYGRFENRNQEMSQVARSLKALARELKVPLLAISQLSRAVEARHPRRPVLSDLRESGSLEQEADLVAFIYRPYCYGEEELQAAGYTSLDTNLAEIILAKHRNGPTGIVRLEWTDQYVRFDNLEGRFEPPEEI